MVPPGIPDFVTRTRLVEAGPVSLTGRAWAGRLEVTRVEVSSDGGSTWSDAALGKAVSPYAWREWSFRWGATPGRHVLCVRATDARGKVQPLELPGDGQQHGPPGRRGRGVAPYGPSSPGVPSEAWSISTFPETST